MLVHGDHDHGAAWRRRQRRLRTHWRHEQLTLQMLLATYEHHAAPRGQMKARSRREESEFNNAFGQKTPPPRAASTMYYRLDDDGDVLAARPSPLVEVRPQSGLQRHTVEQNIQTFVPVQVLDAPVPQMGAQLVEFMQKLDTATLEQVVEVPKLSQVRIPQRSALRRTQKAEQLVEVPTDSAYALGAIISSALRGGLYLCPWGCCSPRRSSRFSPRTGFSQVAADCRADH